MYALCAIAIPAVILSAIGSKAVACSVSIPSVVQAVQEADIVAIGVVDSIRSGEDNDEGTAGIVTLVPDIVLKGDVAGPLRVHWKEVSPSMCDYIFSRQPHNTGSRLVFMLSTSDEGIAELTAYAPMLMYLPGGHAEAERTMLAYLSYVIENGRDPIEIRARGKAQYAMGEEITIEVSVTNRLKVPIITSMDSTLTSDLLSLEFVVNGLGFESPPSHSGLRVVPPETTEGMTIVLQDYFGELGASHYLFIPFLQFPVNQSGNVFVQRLQGEARHQFSVSDETNVENQGWGKVKQLSSP